MDVPWDVLFPLCGEQGEKERMPYLLLSPPPRAPKGAIRLGRSDLRRNVRRSSAELVVAGEAGSVGLRSFRKEAALRKRWGRAKSEDFTINVSAYSPRGRTVETRAEEKEA